jgi:hypothetical protein
MIGGSGLGREQQAVAFRAPDRGDDSGAAEINGPQDNVVWDDDLVDVDESAKGVLMQLFFSYPEKRDYIQRRTKELIDSGLSPSEVEPIVTAEIQADEAKILAAREKRVEQIRAHGTQGEAVPLTRHEARLAAAADKRNQAEEANMGWLQKKKQSLRRWLDESGKK